MDVIFRLSEEPNHLEAPVEVIELTPNFKNKRETLDEMINTEERLVEGVYHITLPSLLNIISDSMEAIITESESPILPKNCIKHSWLNKRSKHQFVYIDVPKHQLDMKYGDTLIKKVGLPRLIFVYEVLGKRVSIKNIVAVKETGFLTKDTEIYYFPFSHVSTEGHVCMGSNTFPEIDEIYPLHSFHLLFLQAPFGEDYGPKTTTGLSVLQLFKSLEYKEFNVEILLPHKLKTLEYLR